MTRRQARARSSPSSGCSAGCDSCWARASELEPVWRGYGIRPQSAAEEHQARIVLVDDRGFQRIGFPIEQATPERIAHDMRMLEDEAG